MTHLPMNKLFASEPIEEFEEFSVRGNWENSARLVEQLRENRRHQYQSRSREQVLGIR